MSLKSTTTYKSVLFRLSQLFPQPLVMLTLDIPRNKLTWFLAEVLKCPSFRIENEIKHKNSILDRDLNQGLYLSVLMLLPAELFRTSTSPR